MVWNERTGNVVGGHQRLKALDALEGSPDYLVPVAVVDLDPVTEKAQNVFLNNGEAQGQWDLLALGDLFKEIPAPQIESTGFDLGELYGLFGTDPTRNDVAPNTPRADEPAPDPVPTKREADDAKFDRIEAENGPSEQGDFYVVAVFASDAARTEFLQKLGLPDGRYVDGKRLLSKLVGDAGQ